MRISTLLVLVLVLTGSAQQLNAQGKGSVYGIVSEELSGSTLPGATIFVKGL
jgi:hypothetical protein